MTQRSGNIIYSGALCHGDCRRSAGRISQWLACWAPHAAEERSVNELSTMRTNGTQIATVYSHDGRGRIMFDIKSLYPSRCGREERGWAIVRENEAKAKQNAKNGQRVAVR